MPSFTLYERVSRASAIRIWKLVDDAETITNMGPLFQHGSENREERDSDKSGFLNLFFLIIIKVIDDLKYDV